MKNCTKKALIFPLTNFYMHKLANEYLIFEKVRVMRRELVILQVGRAGGIGKRGEAFTFINNENKGL